MSFRPYMHIEKFGNTEVEGIEVGRTYVFPKIDGTNSSVWREPKLEGSYTSGGSRTRELTLDNDNQGFLAATLKDYRIFEFLVGYPTLRLYGEWLVPHTLKTYREDAWRKFWIFDVYNDETEQYLRYEEYQPLLEEFGLDYLAPIAIITNADSSMYIETLNKNNFLIKDGEGIGEGIVIKNYDYYNKFGRQTWAKIITSDFKEKHYKEMGAPEIGGEPVEMKIANKFVTQSLVDKVVAKIINENEGWSSKYIPRLLETVYYDLINEEMWEILKEYKRPTINFKALSAFTIGRIKELRKDLF